MSDSKISLINSVNKFLQGAEESNNVSGQNQGIVTGGCCNSDEGNDKIIFRNPVFNDASGVDPQDVSERDEYLKRPTGMMDRLVDIFGIDDTRVYGQNGKIVVDARMGDDEVNVTKNVNGGVTVEVSGRKYEFTAEQAKRLEIRGGSGETSSAFRTD